MENSYSLIQAKTGYIIHRDYMDRFGKETYAFSTIEEALEYFPCLFDTTHKRRSTD